MPEPIGQGHVSSRRKERESNPQGCEARPGSSGVPSPFGLPFRCIKAAAAGIEPASGRLTVAFPYQHRTHRIVSFSQDGRIRTGDLVLPRHAESQTFPRPESRAPSGSRTRTSAMARQQATATSWALGWKPNCQRPKYDQSTGRDSNPRRRITGAVSLPLDDQCVGSVGPAGLEPAPAWLRARDAAANTLVPSKLKSIGAEGVEPTACVL